MPDICGILWTWSSAALRCAPRRAAPRSLPNTTPLSFTNGDRGRQADRGGQEIQHLKKPLGLNARPRPFRGEKKKTLSGFFQRLSSRLFSFFFSSLFFPEQRAPYRAADETRKKKKTADQNIKRKMLLAFGEI